MKKIFKKLIVMALSCQTILLPIICVNGQTDENYQVKFDFYIELNKQEFYQDHATYDIFDQNDPDETRTPVWSQPNQSDLASNYIPLAPGDYTLRMYDGGEFKREGKDLAIKQANLKTHTGDQAGQAEGLAEDKIGQIKELADGSKVYEFDFTLSPDTAGLNPDHKYYDYTIKLTADSNNQDPNSQEAPQDPPENPSHNPIVSLTLTDELGQAVAEASVLVSGLDQTYSTDSQGQVELGELAPGDYNFTAQKNGYTMDFQATVEPAQNPGDKLNINLNDFTPPQIENLVTISLIHNSQPVPNHLIRFAGSDIATDQDGKAVFSVEENGIYDYEVFDSEALYDDLSRKGQLQVTDENKEFTIELTDKPNPEDPSQTSEEAPVNLTIKVCDQTGQGVEGVELLFYDQVYTSDQNGQITINDLKPASYDYDIMSLPEGYQISEGEKTGQIKLSTSPDQEVTINIEKLDPPAQKTKLTILAQDQDGQPVQGLKLKINGQELTTGQNGLTSHIGLDQGVYAPSLVALPEGYELAQDIPAISIDSNEDFQLTVELKKKVQAQELTVKIVDQFDQAIPQAKLEVDSNTYTSDSNGQVNIPSIKPGEYSFQVSDLDSKFNSDNTGHIKVQEGLGELTITLTRQVTPAQATIQVYDQDSNPVAGAKVTFGGLSGETNSQGQVNFTDLDFGKYYYNVTSPEGYEANQADDRQVQIGEGDEFSDKFTLTKKAPTGSVKFQVRVDGKKVKNAEVKINNQTYTSDQDGFVTVDKLPVGSYKYEVTKAPGYDKIANNRGELTIQANHTAEVIVNANQVTGDPSSQATDANTKFIHEATGVEVWVSEQDSKNIVKLDVNKSVDPQTPKTLADKSFDLYELKFLNANNQAVELTSPAQIKLPTRPVTGQIKAYRVEADQASEISFILNKQKASFSDQKLGQFALVYGPRESKDQVKVTKTTGVEKNKDKGDLPGTGEAKTATWIIILTLTILIIGIGLLIYKPSKKRFH